MSRIALIVLLSLLPSAIVAGDFGNGTTANTAAASGLTYLCSNTAVSDGTVTTLTTNLGSWGGGGGTITFKHMRSAGGGSYSFVAQSSALTALTGSNAYTVNFTNVLKGDYFGYYLSSNRPKGKTATGGSGTSYYYSGNHTTGTQSYTSDSNPISLAGHIEITADITSSTTWDTGGSPYIINPSGASGGTIKVRSGATLTIDSTNGAIEVQYNEDCDFQIGNGSGDAGDLLIKAAGGTITFKIKTGGNLIIDTHGSINFSSTSYRTTFTRYSSSAGENNPGALQFDAGQTKQSGLQKCDFSYLGYDSKDGALYVKSSAAYVPTLNDITFDNCNTSAIRMDGNGINVLKEGNVTLPLSVTNTTYVLYLSAVTSTSSKIVFPDPTTPDAASFKLSGTNQVGDSSNSSGWTFLDSCTFKCASSSTVQIVNGYVWGTSEARPTFENDSGSPSYSHWVGLVDDSSTKINRFGEIGPFAYLTVRDATTGFDINKGTSYVPVSGARTLWRFPSLIAKKCTTGIRVRTHRETTGVNAGYTTQIENAELGATSSSDDCNTACILVDHGRAVLDGCQIKGAVAAGVKVGTTNVTNTYDVTLRNCSITDSSGDMGVLVDSSQGAGTIVIEGTIIEGFSTAVDFFQTSTGGYTPTRTLTMRHSFLSATNSGHPAIGLNVYVQTAAVCTIFVEDCTVSGVASGDTNYGLRLRELRSSSTCVVRKATIDSNTDYGAYVDSGANNTCEYTFEECSITGNGNGGSNEGGIRDLRTQSAKVVASHCMFASNNPYNAYDDDNTQLMLAENCYWNSSTGAGATINGNVDAAPYLARPYIGWLIGGSPAGVSALGINNATAATTYADQLHIVDDDAIAVKWTFASDFNGSTQSAYEIEFDNDSGFGSLTYDGSKVSSSSTDISIAPTMAAGTVYYLRVRMWDANDRVGPWYYHTFRTNSVPAQVGNTNRSHLGGVATADATPQLVWERPTDADEDPLHFRVEIDNDSGFGSPNVTLESSSAGAAFEFSSDSGTTWNPWPGTGAQAGATIRVRCTVPSASALANGTWYWRVRATDGFENGSWSAEDPGSSQSFVLTRSYALSGVLTSNGSTPVGGVDVKAYVNGTYDSTVTTDNSGGAGTGSFSFALTANLVAGDILFLFRDGGTSTTRAARVVQFTGGDMSNLNLQYKRLYIQQTQDDPLVNADFLINTSDSDIPWTYSSGTVQFSADLAGSGDGVHLIGQWDMTAAVDCATNDAELTVNSTGTLRTLTYNIDLHKLDNDGTLEITGGSRLTIDNSNSTSSGTLRVYSSTLRLKKAGGITFTVDRGTAEFRNATLDVDTGDVSSLIIDTSDPASTAVSVLDCTGTTFSKMGLTIESDGIVAAFNDNIFSGGVSTRHIYWKAEDARTITTFRGTQFNYSLGGGEFNVEAGSGADVLALNMVRSGGERYGEGYDKNGGSEGDSLDNKVLWTLMPPLNVAATLGDTRVRITWTANDQSDLTNAGYNVYRATSEGGSYTKINSSLVTDAFYNDDNAGGGLTNGTAYWYYVTCIDTNPSPDTESGGSARVSATPAASSISLLTPNTTYATSVLAMTVIGTKTHWDGSATLAITLGGGSGFTLNDTLVLSPTLMLGDATLSSATTGSWTVTAARDNVWSIAAYDESDTETLAVSSNANENRPIISYSGLGGDTSGTFTFSLSFDANGGDSIDTTTLEMYASRSVTVASSPYAAGFNLAQLPSFWDSIDTSAASVTISQVASNKLFDNGEYTLWFRIGNSSGKMSERVSVIIYVEGAGTDVLKCATLLLQGTTMNATVTGTGLSTSDAVSFGSGVTVNSVSGTSSSLTVNVTISQTADCGPRTITTNAGAKSGIVVVEYPTNLYPTTTNSEPSRNPAVCGLNVFLMNGAFFKSETDIATRGRMAGISWSRFYRSDITYNGPLGNGWLGHYFQRCLYDSGSGDIWWYTPDGRRETFADVTGGFSAPVGVYVNATRETTHSTITLTDRHGYSCVFDSKGRLWRCIDRNGNIVECTYNYAGQLTTITDDRSLTYTIAYQSNGRVDTVTDNVYSSGSPRVVEYEYDSNGDLTEQKAPTTGRYDGSPKPRISYIYRYQSHRLTECVNPNEAAQGGTPASYMENQYEYDANAARWQVVAQRLGGQDQWLYLRYVSSTSIRAIDRRGLRTDYTIDASGRATKVRRYTKIWSVDVDEPITHSTVTEVSGKIRSSDPDYFDTDFTYNSNHEVLTTTYPRGNKVTYTYALSAASQTSGTATSCSANVLTKTSAGWTGSAFVGMTLRMGSDVSNYRYYAITANTTDTITVDATFSLSGDGWGASAYAVYNLNSDPLAAGNVLTVTRSDEALGSESDLVTTYTYEPRYQFVRTVTNPRSKTTTYTYDYEDSSSTADAAHGNLVKVAYHSVTSGQPSAQNIVVYMTYDQYGRLVTSVDGEGNVTLNKYYTGGGDPNFGFLYQRISAYGSLDLTTEFDYNGAGVMTAQWPPRAFDSGVTKDDFKTTYTVNELDQVVKVTGRLLRTSGSDRKDVYYYYDANGNVTNTFSEYVTSGGTQPTDPADFTVTTGFDKPSSAMAAGWIESSATYDILNRVLTSTVDAVAGSSVEQYTSYTYYDANDNVTSTTSAQGLQSKRVLDERDMVYQSIAGANSDAVGTFTSNYDANGNVSTSVDARGYTTTYTYDGFDRTTRVDDPAGHYRTTTYDANSNVLYSRAYNSAATLLAESLRTYDEIDRTYKTETTAKDHEGNNIGDGLTTSTTLFDKNSRVTSSTDDNGVTFYRFYDAASRVSYTRDAVGNETSNVYNSDGAVTKTSFYEINGLTNALEKSHVEYDLDKMNRKIAFRDQRYTVSTFDTQVDYAYDSASQLVTFTDAGGITTDYVYDLLGRNTRVTRKPTALDSSWTITDTVYDKASRATRRTIYETPDDTSPSDPQHTDYVYDERSRLILMRRADGDVFTRRYDANGNVIQWTDPEGSVIDNVYDSRNLLSYRNITKGDKVMGGTYECYGYDGLRRLTSCSNYDGSRLMVADAWQYNTLSLPEVADQTVCDSRGNLYPTHTLGAEYDATGRRTAKVSHSGRRVEYTHDQINRVNGMYDVTNGVDIGTFVYAGSRLIQRTTGDGTQMNVDYEDAGCGCGGFSAFVERVEYSRLSDGQVLWAEDRRYDVKGNVTALRWDHEGHFGEVYRYDNTNRLTDTYMGVDCTTTNLASYATSSPPSTFSVKRTYALDSRGNRTGSTGKKEVSDEVSPTYSRDFNYTVYDADVGNNAANMNTYSAIDGDNFEYNKKEEMSRDRSTEDYLGWDYRGLLVAKDDDAPSSPLATPHTLHTHDCMGRLCLTEFGYDDGMGGLIYTGHERSCFFCTSCGGCTSAGVQPDETHTGGAGPTDSPTDTEHDYSPGAPIPKSGDAINPFLGHSGPTGDTGGDTPISDWVDPPAAAPFWRFHARNQLGSLMGVTNLSGERVAEYGYGENGEVLAKFVLLDAAMADISSTAHNTPSSGQSTITMVGTPFTADQYNGAQIVVAVPAPAAGSDTYRVGTVIDTTTSTLVITDNSTLNESIAKALYSASTVIDDFVLFDFNDNTQTNAPSGYTLGGTWSGVSHSAGTTTLTRSSGSFDSWLVGCLVVPNVNFSGYFRITGVTATTLTVTGNLTTIAASGDYFRVHVPIGVNKTTGTLAAYDPTEEVWTWDTAGTGSRRLWASYLYVSPMLGYTDENSLTVGGQGGTNKLGQYHCNNRRYDINGGRWISPDQASSPWFDLFDYAFGRILQAVDATGLSIKITSQNRTYIENIMAALREICPCASSMDITDEGYLIPSPNFCKIVQGNGLFGCPHVPNWMFMGCAAGHSNGCTELACVLCSPYLVEITEDSSNKGNRYIYGGNNVLPDGKSYYKNKAGKAVDANGKIEPKGSADDARAVSDGKCFTGRGKGSGGTVYINDIIAGNWNGTRGPIRKTLARALAHELGHACNGIRGDVWYDNLGDNFDVFGQPIPGRCTESVFKEWRACNTWYTGTGAGDLEEGRVIGRWENPIAREIDPRADQRKDHG